MDQRITPSLWFDLEAEEAATYYCSVFPNSRILSVSHYTEDSPRPAGTVLAVDFELNGLRFVGINGGPEFTFDEAVSFQIHCRDQAEIDHYWDTFVRDGGEESQCGWVRDKYGLSWQVVPEGMPQIFAGPDREKASRVMQAMLGMKKLDVAALNAAAEGTG